MFNFRIVVFSEERKLDIFQAITDSYFKGALLRPLRAIAYMNQVLGSGQERFYYCKETVMTIPIVIYAQKNFFLVNEIDYNIDKFKSAGLIEYWDIKTDEDDKSDQVALEKPPEILTIDHLKGGFQIIILGNIISLIVFIVELIITFFKKMFYRKKNMY